MPTLFFILRAAFVAAVLQASAAAVPARTAQTVQTGPPCLKINDYTVLYLSPVAPYRDARGMLVAPAGHLAALLGVDAKTAPDGNTITLVGNGHMVAFTAGGFAPAGIQPAAFSLPIRWHGTGEIIAPVEQVALGLGIRCEWDPQHRVLQIHSSAALSDQEDNIHSFPFSDFAPDPAISPMSFRMTVSSKPSGLNTAKNPALKGFGTKYNYRYRIVLHNGSARTILDDSVVDVVEEHASDTRGDMLGKPGSTSNGAFGSVRREIKVSPGGTYYLAAVGSHFAPIEAVLIACGSRTP